MVYITKPTVDIHSVYLKTLTYKVCAPILFVVHTVRLTYKLSRRLSVVYIIINSRCKPLFTAFFYILWNIFTFFWKKFEKEDNFLIIKRNKTETAR